MYAILDIETTGGQYNQEGITEIAIYQFDGHQVTDQFISLINPEREIQPFVVKLTGINNQMLRNAPKFFEVAKRIVEITEGCTLVAHNASFDYRILQTEFRRLGYDFKRETLCTVELSQQLLPEKESYSLGKLTRSLGIPVSQRHRASGDAMATVKLFKYLLEKDSGKNIITQWVKNLKNDELPIRLIKIVEELPERVGVYYVHNKSGSIVYVGKDKNIKRRVNQHFTSSAKRDVLLQKNVHTITYEETGTELIASLKHAQEVAKIKPKYNRKKTTKALQYILRAFRNANDYLCFSVDMLRAQYEFITTFDNLFQAQNFLYKITEEFELCPKLTSISQAKEGCYNASIGKCKGACMNLEPAESYNTRAYSAIEKYGFTNQTMALIDKGRFVDEKSIILIENGKIKGYGFINLNYQLSHLDIVNNLITPLSDSLENRHIIQSHMRKTRNLQIKNYTNQIKK